MYWKLILRQWKGFFFHPSHNRKVFFFTPVQTGAKKNTILFWLGWKINISMALEPISGTFIWGRGYTNGFFCHPSSSKKVFFFNPVSAKCFFFTPVWAKRFVFSPQRVFVFTPVLENSVFFNPRWFFFSPQSDQDGFFLNPSPQFIVFFSPQSKFDGVFLNPRCLFFHPSPGK